MPPVTVAATSISGAALDSSLSPFFCGERFDMNDTVENGMEDTIKCEGTAENGVLSSLATSSSAPK